MRRLFARLFRSSSYCSAWDPPDASAGRDTHVCLLPRGHGAAHLCKCGWTW